jgi:hypothetical protein
MAGRVGWLNSWIDAKARNGRFGRVEACWFESVDWNQTLLNNRRAWQRSLGWRGREWGAGTARSASHPDKFQGVRL